MEVSSDYYQFVGKFHCHASLRRVAKRADFASSSSTIKKISMRKIVKKFAFFVRSNTAGPSQLRLACDVINIQDKGVWFTVLGNEPELIQIQAMFAFRTFLKDDGRRLCFFGPTRELRLNVVPTMEPVPLPSSRDWVDLFSYANYRYCVQEKQLSIMVRGPKHVQAHIALNAASVAQKIREFDEKHPDVVGYFTARLYKRYAQQFEQQQRKLFRKPMDYTCARCGHRCTLSKLLVHLGRHLTNLRCPLALQPYEEMIQAGQLDVVSFGRTFKFDEIDYVPPDDSTESRPEDLY